MDSTLPERLRLLRGEMPQAEFAAKVGIHKSSWGRYERGVGEPAASDLARLCAVCGVTPFWLLYGQGDMREAGSTEAGAGAVMPAGPAAMPLTAERDGPAAQPVPRVPADMSGKDGDEAPACRQCRWLEARLEQTDRERRELAQENRQLWRENGELRERVARLEERLRHAGEADLPEKTGAAREA